MKHEASLKTRRKNKGGCVNVINQVPDAGKGVKKSMSIRQALGTLLVKQAKVINDKLIIHFKCQMTPRP